MFPPQPLDGCYEPGNSVKRTMDRIATLTVLNVLINLLVDKGVLSEHDKQNIYTESAEVLAELTDESSDVTKAIAYLRHLADVAQ